MSQPSQFQAKLFSARTLSPSVRELVLERVDGAPVLYKAGQFAKLSMPVGGGIKRAYSIASAPDGTSRFTIAVTRVLNGPGSNFLHQMNIGDEVTSQDPQGVFVRSEELHGPSIFIATGTGLAPLWSMIKDALRAGERSPLWLLFGVRYENEIIYRSEIEALAAEFPNFRPHYTLSQGDSSWGGRRGYVQLHLPSLHAELVATGLEKPVNAFICGLKGMVGAVREVLRDTLKFDRKNVHSERYD